MLIVLNHYGDICYRMILDQVLEIEEFLYLSVSTKDDGCTFDYYFTDLVSALEYVESYGITEERLGGIGRAIKWLLALLYNTHLSETRWYRYEHSRIVQNGLLNEE